MTGLSTCPAIAEAVSVWPSCAVPEMVGVVTVRAASSTAAVARLVVAMMSSHLAIIVHSR